MEWEESRFDMDPLAEPVGQTISGDTTAALMEALTQNDAMRELLIRLPSLERRYRLSDTVQEELRRLDLEAQEQSVLAGFAAEASLREVLDRCPLRDLQIGQIFRKLLEHELLLPVESRPGL